MQVGAEGSLDRLRWWFTACGTDTLDDWLAFGHALYTPVITDTTSLWPGSPPFTGAVPASHIVSAKLGNGATRGDDDQNVAGNALRQVLAAADGLRMDYLSHHGMEQPGLFIVPILVTGAPLFYCEIGGDGQVSLEQRPAVDVWGYATDGRRVRVYVMQESHVTTFAADLRDRASQAAQ